MTVTLAILTFLVCCVPAKSATASELRTKIRAHVRTVEQAKTTLRFFRNHSILFYKWRTKRVAHLERDRARARVRVGRAHLRRLRSQLAVLVQPIPHLEEWLCIHSYEGAWDDPNGPYYGGLQMDLEFQQTYAPWLLRAKGTADHWTPREQMLTAERAYKTRGFYPWPNTARYCGLI